jgi:hypothetical protein
VPGQAIPEFRKVPAARPQSEAPSIASKTRQPDQEAVANFIEPQEGDQARFSERLARTAKLYFRSASSSRNHWSARDASSTKSLTDGDPRESAP